MKRFFVVICTLVLVAFAVQAQAGKMYGGLKAGANFADLSDLDDSSMRTGFQGGLFVGTQVNDQFGFRVEGLWVMKGAEGKTDDGTGNLIDVTLKLDYIEFPLLFVYDVPAGETAAFSLFAGPTLGFNIKAESEAGGQTYDEKDYTESFEFGATFGVGIAKKMASGKSLGVEGRYSLGATTVAKDAQSGDPEPKNRGIGVMAFFSVPLGAQN